MAGKKYEQRLRAIGRLIDQNQLQDVSITEMMDGVLVSGAQLVYLRNGAVEATPKSVQLSSALIERLEHELERSWFGRDKRNGA